MITEFFLELINNKIQVQIFENSFICEKVQKIKFNQKSLILNSWLWNFVFFQVFFNKTVMQFILNIQGYMYQECRCDFVMLCYI